MKHDGSKFLANIIEHDRSDFCYIRLFALVRSDLDGASRKSHCQFYVVVFDI